MDMCGNPIQEQHSMLQKGAERYGDTYERREEKGL